MGIKEVQNKKSPCISICEFSGQNGWCQGCGRTRQECKQWKSMKLFDRIEFTWEDIVRSGLVRDFIMTKEMVENGKF